MGWAVITGSALAKAVDALVTRPLRVLCWRAMRAQFVSDPLGKNRPIVVSRFGVTARVLYLALEPITALHEIQAFGGTAQRLRLRTDRSLARRSDRPRRPPNHHAAAADRPRVEIELPARRYSDRHQG